MSLLIHLWFGTWYSIPPAIFHVLSSLGVGVSDSLCSAYHSTVLLNWMWQGSPSGMPSNVSFLSGLGSSNGRLPNLLTMSNSKPASMKARIILTSNFATFIPEQGWRPVMPRRQIQFMSKLRPPWKKRKRTNTPSEIGERAFLVLLSTWAISGGVKLIWP